MYKANFTANHSLFILLKEITMRDAYFVSYQIQLLVPERSLLCTFKNKQLSLIQFYTNKSFRINNFLFKMHLNVPKIILYISIQKYLFLKIATFFINLFYLYKTIIISYIFLKLIFNYIFIIYHNKFKCI